MQNPLVRSVVAIIVGVVVAFLVVGGVEYAGHQIWPPPEGLDLTKPEDQARLMAVIPTQAKIAVITAWFLGSLVGAITALKIGKQARPAWIVGLLMIIASVTTTLMFPHPVWMIVSAIVLPIVAVWIAQRLVSPES